MVTVLLALLAVAPPAQAHSELVRSDPPNGGMVAPGRSFLTLWFGEPISPNASAFDLHLTDGTGVAATITSLDDDGTLVRLETAELARGTYELDYRVISLDDGHPAGGTLLFGVGLRPVLVSDGADALPGPLVGAVRWLDLAGLLLVIGALSVSGQVMEGLGDAGRRARHRARTLALLGVLAAFYAGVLTPLARTRMPGNPVDDWAAAAWDTVARTPWGKVWAAEQAVLLVAVVLVWRWARGGDQDPARSRAPRVALAALGAVAFLEAASGHPADLPSGVPVAVLASATHLLAAGVWAGGLFVLVLCVVPLMRRDPDLRGPALSTVWRRYSPMAAVASVVLLATGLYQAGVHVPRAGLLDSTFYGWAVLVKTAVVVLALALASVTTLLVNPGLAAALGRRIGRWPGWAPVPLHRLPALVTAEVTVLMLGVLVAALVTSVPTAREVDAARVVSAPHREDVDGLYITFEELPAGPELATVEVRVQPTVLPPPAPVSAVRVTLQDDDGQPQDDLALTAVEPGSYQARASTPGPGRWTAIVVVERAGMPDAVTRASWTVADPDHAGPSPFRVVTAGLAVLLLGALAGLLVRTRSRRRPRPVATTDVMSAVPHRSRT